MAGVEVPLPRRAVPPPAIFSPEASVRLQEQFVSFFSPETINEALRASTAELAARARVQNFVPMLAERRARERLAALTHT